MLIRVVTLANLINKVDLMPKCILIMPYIVVLSLLNAKNWLYPAVDYWDTLILIIIPIKLSTV